MFDFGIDSPSPLAVEVPTTYVRETTFTAFNLIAIAGAFAAGWVCGNVVRVLS